MILVMVAVAGAAGAGELPGKQEGLDRFVAAVGGRQALLDRPTLRYEGVIIQDLSWTDPQHTETPFVAEASPDGTVLHAETDRLEDLPAHDTGQPRNKLRWLMHPRCALVVEEFFPDLEVVRKEVRNGRPVVVLEPAGMDPAYPALYFDEETGLLNHIGFYNDLKEWREVEGVLFPHVFAASRKGGHTTHHFEAITAGKR
jgi:hypothetical protein